MRTTTTTSKSQIEMNEIRQMIIEATKEEIEEFRPKLVAELEKTLRASRDAGFASDRPIELKRWKERHVETWNDFLEPIGLWMDADRATHGIELDDGRFDQVETGGMDDVERTVLRMVHQYDADKDMHRSLQFVAGNTGRELADAIKERIESVEPTKRIEFAERLAKRVRAALHE